MLAALVSARAVGPPTIAITDTAASAAFVVRLSATARRAVSVRFATRNGSATAGSDYAGRRGTLVFARGERAKWIRVPVVDDAEAEGEETFFVALSRPRSARLVCARASARIRPRRERRGIP